jgi:hypothetical protein
MDGPWPPGGHPYEYQIVDGRFDWIIQVGTKDEPGVPSWQTMKMLYDPSKSRSYARFGAFVRLPNSPPYVVPEAFMPSFPFLDFGLGALQIEKNLSQALYDALREQDAGVDWFKKNPRPFYYDMTAQQFSMKTFTVFQFAGSYYYNSYLLPPIIAFESPFGFYNFDRDVTTNPEKRQVHLLVRAEYAPEEDTFAHHTRKDRSSFRYTWKTHDDQLWDYSVNVAGSHTYTYNVQIGDTLLKGVPAAEYAEWVVSKKWPLVTFVESVSGTQGSEGLYYYTAQAQASRPWVDGYEDEVPDHFEIPYLEPGVGLSTTNRSGISLVVNYRGEYNSAFFRSPELYFSPVDKRLHLKYAEGGLWYIEGGLKLEDHRMLRVHNLNNDAYIDGWTREYVSAQKPGEEVEHIEDWAPRAYPGHVEEALYAFDSFLVYSGESGTELRQTAPYSPSLFEMRPPTNSDSWHKLRDHLRPFRENYPDPFDLRSWFARYPGKMLISTTGRITNVRAIKNGGIHFVIDMEPGFQTEGVCDTSGLQPGKYIVEYDGSCRISPLVPPEPHATIIPATFTQYKPGAIHVELTNSGGADLPKAKIALQPITPGGEQGKMLYEYTELLEGEQTSVSFQWPPVAMDFQTLQAGTWTFMVYVIDDATGAILNSSKPAEIEVEAVPEGTPLDVIKFGISSRTFGVLLVLIVIRISVAGGMFWVLWRVSNLRKPENNGNKHLFPYEYTQTSVLFWVGPIVFMFFLGAYFVARFEGRWAELDTNLFIEVIRNIQHQAQLVPKSGEVYPGGYGYQSISTVFLTLTGLEIQEIQQLVYPLMASLATIPAWILYREVAGNARGATITTLLLFTQPEFLFVVIRGSHEKFTRTYMLLCLFLLFRSFKLRDYPRLFTLHILIFYLLAFALASTNNALAMSFYVSIGIAMGLRWWQEKAWWLRNRVVRLFRKEIPSSQFRLFSSDVLRLLYVTLTCIGIIYIVIFYVYPPGQGNVSFFTKLGQDSVSAASTSTPKVSNEPNPYAHVKSSWTSGYFFLLVSFANWVVLGSAMLIWVWKGVRWLWKGDVLQEVREWLPWLLFASFGVQAVGSVFADMGGGVGNIQVRLFPSISMIAVMLVGPAFAQLRPRRFVKPVQIVMSAGIAFFAFTAGLKVTNEPILSNKWMFYRAPEVAAVEWTDTHLKYARIWSEVDERIWTAFTTNLAYSANDNKFLMDLIRRKEVRDILTSDITLLHCSRKGIPLPIPPQSFRAYDNGEAQLYHLRPETPHQE